MGLFLRTYFEDLVQSRKENIPNLDSFFRAAHDLRSPLSALNLTLDHFKKNSPSLTHLDLLDETVRRINSIAEEILQKRRVQNSSRSQFLVESALETFFDRMSFQLSEKAILRKSSFSINKKSNVQGNLNDFDRILSNLVQNSIEAGATDISFSFAKEKKQIKISVEDNGSGIPPRVLREVGQEGFTTKPMGNGLGLHSAIQTIRSWGGDLLISSESNKGTRIEIQLVQS